MPPPASLASGDSMVIKKKATNCTNEHEKQSIGGKKVFSFIVIR